jgi:hypothetical protein
MALIGKQPIDLIMRQFLHSFSVAEEKEPRAFLAISSVIDRLTILLLIGATTCY